MRKNGEEQQLQHAKRAYKAAIEVGNRKEEARWANIIGNIFKNRGEYVKALAWIRKDYEVSERFLPDKDLLPTCNTLGELHLRLQDFKEALYYQEKHLELATDANDLAEQQRASTQLGRTYHEIFLKSEDDHSAVRNAKKYFNSAMELAKNLMENQFCRKSPFVTEYIDAHNNLGMLEIDLDNLEEAKEILTKGLKICDEEEVGENDDSRSRLHHNLGIVYMEFRDWEKAEEHIKKDISICESIGHCQGEAKGLVNFGELCYRVQKYTKAISCYQKALQLAKSMEDEDALVNQIKQNIETVEAAIKVMEELKQGEQYLKKIERKIQISRGKADERKILLQQLAYVDILIEKSGVIFAWKEHLRYATMKMKIAEELCDKEKLADSFLVIGESNQKLRKFKEALNWYTKSWEVYKLIGDLEGQALSKIEMGNVLDADGFKKMALKAFKEGYRIASEANIPSVQLSALENMHYSYMIRFDKVEKARNLQMSINELKRSTSKEIEVKDTVGNCCSETETEIESQSTDRSEVSFSPERSVSNSTRSNSHSCPADLNENAPLISFLHPGKKARKLRAMHQAAVNDSIELPESPPRSASISACGQAVSQKRNRSILSNDEEDENGSWRRTLYSQKEDDATSTGLFAVKNINNARNPYEFQDISPVVSKCATIACTPVILEESSCSHRSKICAAAGQDATDFRYSSTNGFYHPNCGANASKNLSYEHKKSNLNSYPCSDESCQHMIIKIDEYFIHILQYSCMMGDKLSIEQMKVEVACLYYLQLPSKKRETGLVPVVEDIKYDGRTLEALETVDVLKNHKLEKGWMEGSVGVWVPKRVMKLYIDCCKELSEQPNLKVLKNLYNLEVSEDEVIASDCGLQDVSIAPLLNALQAHKTVAVIDLSHNLLGNETMEGLKQVFMSSGQNYGALALDLHGNRLGPTALFQICECPVLYSRLEVLNISGNRLTDSCASYLSTILKNFQALYNLNIENCAITSRTIQKIADSLDSRAALTHFSLGYNLISGNAIINLLLKIATLKRFQELDLTGIKLSKPVVDILCELAKNTCLSGLMVGRSSIGTDSALCLTSSLSNGTREMKLDLSSCILTCDYILNLNAEVSLVNGILELNLDGNPIMQEGGIALASLLANPQCCLKVLVISKCRLGLLGILRVLETLSENCCLEELNLAGNICQEESYTYSMMLMKESSNLKHTSLNFADSSLNISASKEVVASPQEVCTLNAEYNQREVADSDDDTTGETAVASGVTESNISLSKKSQLGMDSQFIQKLIDAVKMAAQLQMLNLSNNGFCQNVAEKLCAAWSSSSKVGLAQSHILDNVIHLSVQGKKCCGGRPCCRRI